MCLSVASLASSSAFSLPVMPTWLGIQASLTVMSSSLIRRWISRRFLITSVAGLVMRVVRVVRADNESE